MRRALTFAAASFGVAIAEAAVYVGAASMQPSAATYAALPRIEVPSLEPGSFAYMQNPAAQQKFPSEYLFVRVSSGELRVFEIPTSKGRFTMPDRMWWKPGSVCKRFEPDFVASQFRCMDSEASEWVRTKFRWSLEGKSLYPEVVEDMLHVLGRLEAGNFVVGAKTDA